jgi:hypothetical protein
MKLLRRLKPYGLGWIILHAVVILGTFFLGRFARF